MSYGYSNNPYIDSAIARWHDKWLQDGAPKYEEEDEQEENEEDD